VGVWSFPFAVADPLWDSAPAEREGAAEPIFRCDEVTASAFDRGLSPRFVQAGPLSCRSGLSIQQRAFAVGVHNRAVGPERCEDRI